MKIAVMTAVVLSSIAVSNASASDAVTFVPAAESVQILAGGKPVASYVFRDRRILRPYLAHVRAPGGTQVTRNHPPIEGSDATDHDAMHPGIWLAFGDLSGGDFWRNKGAVEHVEFVARPAATDDGGAFVVKNRYVAAERTVCEEICRIEIRVLPEGYLIVWDSRFSGPAEFYFGDQEEMGLGIRPATPLAVKNGGRMINSDGLVNEKQVWGRQADWCDYSGTIDGRPLGMLVVPDPANFRRSWFHARDYGFLAANPFGVNAFTKGEKSRVAVPPGTTLRLRYAVLIHAGPIDLAAAYRQIAALFKGGG